MTWIYSEDEEDEFRWKNNKNFIAAVGKWGTLAASKVKMSGSEKK